MKEERVYQEEFVVNGDAVIGKIKELLHEGNIRRISIRTEDGKSLIDIPLTVGVVGTLLLPAWAAIGAIAAIAARLTISVEKVEKADEAGTGSASGTPVGGDPGQSTEEPPAPVL